MKIRNNLTRFDYVVFDEDTIKKQETIKKVVKELGKLIEDTLDGYSSEYNLAIDKLEECWMWVGKALKYEMEKREFLKKMKEAGVFPE